jgi:ketopantoate reductase
MSNHYITLENGTDFREIAKILTRKGFPMNHATARNVLMSSLTKLLGFVSTKMGTNLTEAQIKQVLKSPETHEALAEILYEAYHNPVDGSKNHNDTKNKKK